MTKRIASITIEVPRSGRRRRSFIKRGIVRGKPRVPAGERASPAPLRQELPTLFLCSLWSECVVSEQQCTKVLCYLARGNAVSGWAMIPTLVHECSHHSLCASVLAAKGRTIHLVAGIFFVESSAQLFCYLSLLANKTTPLYNTLCCNPKGKWRLYGYAVFATPLAENT